MLGTSGQTYEKTVDDTLPSVSSSEVEQRQEGGYADVTAPEEPAPDTGTEETGTTQSGSFRKCCGSRTEHRSWRGGAANEQSG